jgi:hypothetical protein
MAEFIKIRTVVKKSTVYSNFVSETKLLEMILRFRQILFNCGRWVQVDFDESLRDMYCTVQ